MAGLCLLPRFWPLAPWYWAAAGIASVLLAAEHIIALGNSERHIRIASYSINEIVPLIILAGIVMGVYI